jgi:hypothetical protein
MEELALYLDLVESLGDPFTVFERGWPDPETPQTKSRHSKTDNPPIENEPRHSLR